MYWVQTSKGQGPHVAQGEGHAVALVRRAGLDDEVVLPVLELVQPLHGLPVWRVEVQRLRADAAHAGALRHQLLERADIGQGDFLNGEGEGPETLDKVVFQSVGPILPFILDIGIY